ncbi:MAG: leucine-rich repeat protein, partial [Muribaculaceae bacterium]|nr:leucine-rich repeat protein [Muribaculaceae bacterium]
MKGKLIICTGFCLSIIISGCAYEDFEDPTKNIGDAGIINLAGQISQEYNTRANDDGFADGDVMGVYIVDYEGNNPGKLLSNGNRGDNVRHTFNESNYSWSSAYDLYWKDKHTRIDVYGYYPYASQEDVNNYSFTVKTNQAKASADGVMGGYEASDFLWGKVSDVAPTSNVIRLPLRHQMANARVTLIEGSGFANGEWDKINKQVLVTNTIQDCTIDMSTGVVTPAGHISPNSIIPSNKGDEWRAIVIPQTIPASTTMFSITIDGIPYKFSKNTEFLYAAGKMNNFTIKVDKKESTGAYSLILVDESITAWENDLVSHDATAKEYVIVNVPEAGTLEECIAKAGKDLTKLRNLKLTGNINMLDFATMNQLMGNLSALNLKDVKIEQYDYIYMEDEIPARAFFKKESLVSLVLPDKLRCIKDEAFAFCSNLSGSLTIPEGVEEINKAAFFSCKSYTGSLTLPSSLKKLVSVEGYLSYWDGVFKDCNFTCEINLPENLEELGMGAFSGCKNIYGSLRLPENLKLIGAGAFEGCENLTGSLEIPQGVTNIPADCFNGCWLGGTLTLHNGITTIGESAFANCGFKGELNLPKNLEVISHYAFYNDDFSGNLVLPSTLRTIGDKSFAYNWRLMGTLEIPENVISIGAGAFAHCKSLEGVIFPEALENIRCNSDFNEDAGAFQNCYNIGKIVCKGSMPPYVQEGAFHGVPKDNFTLEVPENAITQYQTAVGWRDFKRISAHHELVCRPSNACALSSKHTQTLIIDAEGEWVMESKPEWCSLSQNSGNKKTEIKLTINAFANTSGNREGDIVFRLKDKDYTHSCHVSQYGYEYKEDEYLTLQSATKGNNGGINIVIIGDGYDAKEIADGTYIKDIHEGIEYFFGIEPYTSYRDYFNVYTAFPLSTESGVGSINTIIYNRFNTTYTGGVGLRCDYDDLFRYVLNAPTVSIDNLDQTLIIVIPNSTDYGGICQMWESGAAIAFCPKSDYGYPFDSRGVMQHEAGGHGFGKLADEYIYHNAFIDFCGCNCCAHTLELQYGKSLGWYDNVELTGKIHEVGWSHLIYDPRYSDIVDIFEGGFMHSRGVFRSEQNSCMNNDIPYYSTISRESIVRRIKDYAGEVFLFDDFIANDKRGSASATRGTDFGTSSSRSQSFAPGIHKGSPLASKKSNSKLR